MGACDNINYLINCNTLGKADEIKIILLDYTG